jgi:hypothetical protein
MQRRFTKAREIHRKTIVRAKASLPQEIVKEDANMTRQRTSTLDLKK